MNEWIVVALVVGVVFVIPVWMIVRKAGYPGAWALLAVVPYVNIIMLWVFAFMKWPVLRGGAGPVSSQPPPPPPTPTG